MIVVELARTDDERPMNASGTIADIHMLRVQIESRVARALDALEAHYASTGRGDVEGVEFTSAYLLMTMQMMGRVVGMIPDRLERERLRLVPYQYGLPAFSKAVEEAIGETDAYR
ncbi:MAG: hypothetical protein ABWY64_21520 [Tardiphaga sp.]